MRKVLLFTLLIINSVFVFGQTEWKSLTDKDFTIEYPDNWDLDKSGQMGTKFYLFSKLSDSSDKFRENVNLIIQDLTGLNLSLDKFVDVSEKQITRMITNGKIVESKRVSNKEFEFHKMIYTGKVGTLDLKFIQYYWVLDNKAFVLTFTSEIKEFDNYVEVGKKIMDSFKILK